MCCLATSATASSCLRPLPDTQILKNTGSTAIPVPYTLAIYSPSYALITGNAWNWDATGSANAGTLSGAVTMVRPQLLAVTEPLGLGVCSMPTDVMAPSVALSPWCGPYCLLS